jgi:hypothetical protein
VSSSQAAKSLKIQVPKIAQVSCGENICIFEMFDRLKVSGHNEKPEESHELEDLCQNFVAAQD